MTDEIQKKTELRIKVPQWISDLLKEHCDLYGVTAVSTITPLLVEYLRHPSRVRDNCSNCFNIKYSEKSAVSGKKKSKTRASKIPSNFAPPKDIAEKEGLDHEKAVSIFVDWAKGKGHTQADWIATYRNACRRWIKDQMPQANNDPILKEVTIPEYEDEEEF